MILGPDTIKELITHHNLIQNMDELPPRIFPYTDGKTTIDLHIEKLEIHQGHASFSRLNTDQPDIGWTTKLLNGDPIQPGQVAIATTYECLRMPPSIGAFVIPRSRSFRSGFVISTGYVDPGWIGKLQFAVFNAGINVSFVDVGASLCSLILTRSTEPSVYEGIWKAHLRKSESPYA